MGSGYSGWSLGLFFFYGTDSGLGENLLHVAAHGSSTSILFYMIIDRKNNMPEIFSCMVIVCIFSAVFVSVFRFFWIDFIFVSELSVLGAGCIYFCSE